MPSVHIGSVLEIVIVIAFFAITTAFAVKESRREVRVAMRLVATWEGLDGALSTVDISRGGCCLRGPLLPSGEGVITLSMPGALPRWRRRAAVRWRAGEGRERVCGVAFLDESEKPDPAWEALFKKPRPVRRATVPPRRIVIAVLDPRPETLTAVTTAIEAAQVASTVAALRDRLGARYSGNTAELRDALRRTLAALDADAAVRAARGRGDGAADGPGAADAIDVVAAPTREALASADVILCAAGDADGAGVDDLRARRGEGERPLLVGVGAATAATAPRFDLLLAEDRDVRELLDTLRLLRARTPAAAAAAAAAEALGNDAAAALSS